MRLNNLAPRVTALLSAPALSLFNHLRFDSLGKAESGNVFPTRPGNNIPRFFVLINNFIGLPKNQRMVEGGNMGLLSTLNNQKFRPQKG